MATFIALMAVLTCGFYAYALVRFAREFGRQRQKAAAGNVAGGVVALPRSTATQLRLDYVQASKGRGIAARMHLAPRPAEAETRQARIIAGSDPGHTTREREMIVSCAIEKDWSILESRHITDSAPEPISRRVRADTATETAGRRPETKDAA
jgi:hypothetical protein